MRRWLQVVILLFAAAPLLPAGQVIDGVVAVVDRHPILQSEWDDAVRFECLMAARPLSQVTRKDRDAALDRLIDQRLIEQRMETVGHDAVSQEEIDRQMARLRAAFPGAADDRKWADLIAGYGLAEPDLAARVAEQLSVLQFIAARFRPSVRIEETDVRRFYREEFVPDLRRRGVRPLPPLEQVEDQIVELLTQRRVDLMLEQWLRTLRAQAVIERHGSVTAAAEKAEMR